MLLPRKFAEFLTFRQECYKLHLHPYEQLSEEESCEKRKPPASRVAVSSFMSLFYTELRRITSFAIRSTPRVSQHVAITGTNAPRHHAPPCDKMTPQVTTSPPVADHRPEFPKHEKPPCSLTCTPQRGPLYFPLRSAYPTSPRPRWLTPRSGINFYELFTSRHPWPPIQATRTDARLDQRLGIGTSRTASRVTLVAPASGHPATFAADPSVTPSRLRLRYAACLHRSEQNLAPALATNGSPQNRQTITRPPLALPWPASLAFPA
jgi:hypothetical protein